MGDREARFRFQAQVLTGQHGTGDERATRERRFFFLSNTFQIASTTCLGQRFNRVRQDCMLEPEDSVGTEAAGERGKKM